MGRISVTGQRESCKFFDGKKVIEKLWETSYDNSIPMKKNEKMK